MASITLVNLNMLFVRYADSYDKELHLPLGLLYLVRTLEDAGQEVDFRDYQLCPDDDPFDVDRFAEFCRDPAPIIGLSCMANLLPFTLLAARRLRELYPDRTIILGGVGAKAVEAEILERFPWIDLIAHGEAERSIVQLVETVLRRGDLSTVPGIFFRQDGGIRSTPPPPRIDRLETIGRPAHHAVDLSAYDAYGMITSRGCPYQCTFCSVAPVWDRKSYWRPAQDVVDEMRELHQAAGIELFLFQDEFFAASKRRVIEFCDALARSGLDLKWKAFARVDMMDRAVMEAMAGTGCVEIRFGIESASARMLERTRKGFTPEMAVEAVSLATQIFPRVDTFFIWGFPDETLEDFHQSLFQMIAFRLMGARILPSLLTLLPQTQLYRELTADQLARLEFCEGLVPEYMITGHEICAVGSVSVDAAHAHIFDFVRANRDLFPGFFLLDVETNIRPKLQLLQEHGFYTRAGRELADLDQLDSCGAHSPKL
jgi:anaerobic magnesium-protoporphyrin IX monomethyl ester cyclase